MTPYRATAGIGESAKNARAFVREHKSIFWDIFKPLIPFIAVLTLIDVAIAYFQISQNPDSELAGSITPGGLIAYYFFSALIISWHRVVLDGPDRFQAMNPLKPENRDWAFIGMGLLVGLIAFAVPMIIGVITGIIAGVTGMTFLMILIAPAVIFAIYLTFKFLFYFPSKATGNNLSLKQSYRLTKGYVWKIIAANILAGWRVYLVMIGYMILAFASLGFLGVAAGVSGAGEEHLTNAGFVAGALIMIPVTFYFQPILTVLGVTVLSNFYQHALQNRPTPDGSAKPQPEPAKEQTASLENDPMNQMEANHQDMNKARKALDKGK